MRIIRVKLDSNTTQVLADIAKRLIIRDASFVEDFYALVRLKGNGTPDDARCEALAQHYAKATKSSAIVLRSIIKKRRQVLRSMVSTAMFQAHTKNSAENDLDFTELYLVSFQKLHRKLRQSECITCSYLSDCDFGKQYGTSVRQITAVIDPDYSKKVHKDCPSLPEIESINEYSKAALFANELPEPENTGALANAAAHGDGSSGSLKKSDVSDIVSAEEEAAIMASRAQMDTTLDPDTIETDDTDDYYSVLVSGSSRIGSQYATTHRGGYCILNDKTIDKLKITDLAIYELSRKFSKLLTKHKKGLFKPVSKLTKDRRQETIKSMSDVTKVIPSEHALPEGVFDKKLVKKELVKNQQLQPEGKKQLLYLLVDTSSSMQAVASIAGTLSFISRAALSASFIIALLRHISEEGGIVYMRCFEGAPSALKFAKNPAEFANLESFISTCSFNGWDTDIPLAISAATSDIQQANKQDELARAEILVITDCCDSINSQTVQKLRSELKDVSLNVLNVAGTASAELLAAHAAATGQPLANLTQMNAGMTSQAAINSLKLLSDNFYQVDPQQPLAKMVQLVGGKKKVENSK